ncbi:phasin family protein [Bradyrhizobium sediminis]|uniref:phasin family protein n=1 Tax=Bradyrhizobium sediminis TaxID=2840469 RepID=UPI00350F625F
MEAAATPTDTSPIGAVVSADTPPIGLQTIATAYSDYTMKSLEEARCFVEKLSGVRSLDKALEIQSEFARQAYETYAADSRKIRELYNDLVMKAFTPSKPPPAAR